jgi:hypothetical protein
MSMTCPHLRHFIRDELRSASFSSAMRYFALHWGHRNFMRRSGFGDAAGAQSGLKGERSQQTEQVLLNRLPRHIVGRNI